jgi:hypothetical protein
MALLVGVVAEDTAKRSGVTTTAGLKVNENRLPLANVSSMNDLDLHIRLP